MDGRHTTAVDKSRPPLREYKKFNYAMEFFNKLYAISYFRLTIVKDDKEKSFIVYDLGDGRIKDLPKRKIDNCIRLRKNIFVKKSCIRKTTKTL